MRSRDASQVFVAPLNRANERLAALRQQQREGADLRAIADAIGAIEADLAPFVERFQLARRRRGRPAAAALRRALGRGARGAGRRTPAGRGARQRACCCSPPRSTVAHDGESLAGAAALPRRGGRARPAAARGRGAGRDRGADGRRAASRSSTRARTRRCASSLPTAGWQWAAAMVLGFVC